MIKRIECKLRDERGQSTVEFALVVIVVLLVSLGIVEFGRAWYRADVLKNAANTGARTYAVGTATQRAGYDASGLSVNGISVTFVPMSTSVRAIARERFQTIVPGILPILSNVTALSRDATYRLEQ